MTKHSWFCSFYLWCWPLIACFVFNIRLAYIALGNVNKSKTRSLTKEYCELRPEPALTLSFTFSFTESLWGGIRTCYGRTNQNGPSWLT
jgi:hypothetical protein